MCTAWQLLPQPTSPRYCYTLAHMLPVLQLCEADTYEVSICTLALYRKFQEIISLVAEYAYIISTWAESRIFNEESILHFKWKQTEYTTWIHN